VADPNGSGRTQIIIAVISLASVLGAAIIAVLPKLLPRQTNPTIATTPTGPTLKQIPDPATNEVTLYFQTNVAGEIVYYPNSPEFKVHFLAVLSDSGTLYFSGCDVLPQDRKASCNRSTNWKMLSLESAGCTSVQSCTRQTYNIPDDLKARVLGHLNP
jgi:hypothetical protein